MVYDPDEQYAREDAHEAQVRRELAFNRAVDLVLENLSPTTTLDQIKVIVTTLTDAFDVLLSRTVELEDEDDEENAAALSSDRVFADETESDAELSSPRTVTR